MSRFLVLTGVAIVALIGTGAASAAAEPGHRGVSASQLAPSVARQAPAPSGGGGLRVSERTVRKFIKRQAMIVANAQPAVFPNAVVTGRKPWAICPRINARLWYCAYHVAMYEDSTIDPPAEYDPEWPIRQSTVRFCGAADKQVVKVRRARSSRRLRVVGGWRMACPLEQDRIDQWNKYGPDWAGPNVTEATPYQLVERPLPPLVKPPADLLPPPAGAPGTDPLGPLDYTVPGPTGLQARASMDTFISCSQWTPNYRNSGYWVYACFWRLDGLPGASPGIFNNVITANYYYWAGDRDIYGRALGRFYWSGIQPQINYVHG